MRRRHVFALIVLAIGLGLLLLNFFQFTCARQYYLDLNRERLDPLGLESHPAAEAEGDAGYDGLTVVFLGDSRAAAWSPPTMPEAFRFVNRGIDAQTSSQVRYRFQYDVALLKPDVVILQIGINDLKTIPLFPDQEEAILARTKGNISEIVAQARELGATVILTTVFPVGEIPLERRPFWSPRVNFAVDEVNAYISSLAAEDIVVFDAYGLLSGASSQRDLYIDELHINSTGYDLLNQELGPLLAALD